jgi:CheY-like chemotaxis protein
VYGVGGLSEPEKKKLLDRASGLDRIILLLLFETGLEIDDLIGARASDLNIQEGTLLIRTSGEEKKISSDVLAELMSYLRMRPGQVYLLEGRCGKPITAKWKRCVLDKMLNKRDKPLRILLAEDKKINQKVMLQMLKKLGYKADIVANGREVLQAQEIQPYDVILMAVQMPEMDGLEAAKAIRHRSPLALQPCIIAITAYALERDRKRCLEAGMDNYLSNPVKIEELRSALESCGKMVKSSI